MKRIDKSVLFLITTSLLAHSSISPFLVRPLAGIRSPAWSITAKTVCSGLLGV